jgi:hypothetical protein
VGATAIPPTWYRAPLASGLHSSPLEVVMSAGRPALLRRSLLLAVLSLGLLLGAPLRAQRLAASAPISPELRALSDRLAGVQAVLARELGIKELLIGGGSSRAVLDNLYFGKPLDARDIDLFVVADRKVTPGLMRKAAARLQAAWPGQQLQGDAELRPRGNPALPPRQSARYNAGYGIFLREPTGEVLDLSFYHSRQDLGLNGCLNIDTIMIPLRGARSLTAVAESLRGKSYTTAARAGLVLDEHDGYRGWQDNRLEVAHPAELTSKPVLWSIRLARAYGKASYNELPAGVVELLREGDAQVKTRPRTKLVSRYLQRLLDDKHADVELKMVRQAGVLQSHAGVRRLLGAPSRWSVDNLKQRLTPKGETHASPKN